MRVTVANNQNDFFARRRACFKRIDYSSNSSSVKSWESVAESPQ